MKLNRFWLIAILFCTVSWAQFPTPQIKFSPEKYVAFRSISPIIMDGKLDDLSWEKAEWTSLFVDIEGPLKPKPFFDTKAKILWDDTYFYFGFEMVEPHLWATLTQRDTVIYFDNDIEIFLDPDGDTHHYYELEVNAYGTEWDLLLSKPYRDPGNSVDNQWNIEGLTSKVYLDGSLNDPSDMDQKWTVEIAIPWQALDGKSAPINGTQWRVNFSRVHWDRDVIKGEYIKQKNPAYNWVWSPQGLINMHYPEMWGFVQFSEEKVGEGNSRFIWNSIEDGKWMLRQLYYAQRTYKKKHGSYTSNFSDLKLDGLNSGPLSWPPQIVSSPNRYMASIYEKEGSRIIFIQEDGKVWVEKKGE